MKYFLFIISLLFQSLNGYNIVFVHIGDHLPSYYLDSIVQARVFNKKCHIYLLANKAAIDECVTYDQIDDNFECVALESLKRSKQHEDFIAKTALPSGFWRYATERFFYLDEFVTKYKLRDVFHLENDNMLYMDLSLYLPVFQQKYPGIAAVFDSDFRCIPGFMYIAHKHALKRMTDFITSHAPRGLNDMQIISMYRNRHEQKYIDNLPLIMESYTVQYELKNDLGQKVKDPTRYYKNIDQFNSIFDGAAIGQFLGGTFDRRFGPGFINETCVFDPSLLSYEWRFDEQRRKVPFAIFQGKAFRINNLHIHSKKLSDFKS